MENIVVAAAAADSGLHSLCFRAGRSLPAGPGPHTVHDFHSFVVAGVVENSTTAVVRQSVEAAS